MHLVLVRHGPAIDRLDPECPPDAERALTPSGRRRTSLAMAGLSTLLEGELVVRTSPWPRARQTAELLVAALGHAAGPHDDELLLPGHGAFGVLGHLLALGPPTVVAVGHAPLLDELVAAALGAPCPSLTRLKKAGAACVVDPGLASAQLAWHLPPRVLRTLGEHA